MKAHRAATFAIGDPESEMIEIPPAWCTICRGVLDPILGKVMQGTTIAWDVWIEGNYEHRFGPQNHVPIPELI